MTNDINYLASVTTAEAFADAEAFFDYINSADAINEMLDKMAPSYDERDTEVTRFHTDALGLTRVDFRLKCNNGLEVK